MSPSPPFSLKGIGPFLDRAGEAREGTTEVGTARKRHVRTKSGSQPQKIRPKPLIDPAKSGWPQIRLNPSLSGKIRQNPDFLRKENLKAHKHKSFWSVTPAETGQSPYREAMGQMFMYYVRNPWNINLFAKDL